MVVGVGYLDEPRAGDLRAKAFGHRAGEDRAPLSADHERRRGDSREQRPAVDRLARRVARRVEPEADGAVPPRDALAGQVGEEGGIRVRVGREEPERGHGRLDGRMPAGRPRAALLHLGEPLGRDRRPRVHDDQPPDPIGVPRGAGDRVVAAHRVADEDRRAPSRGRRGPRRCRARSPRSRRPAALPTRSPRGRAGRAPRRGGAPRGPWRPRRTSERARPPRGGGGCRTGPRGPTRAGGGPRPRIVDPPAPGGLAGEGAAHAAHLRGGQARTSRHFAAFARSPSGELPKPGSDPGFGFAGGELPKSGSDPGFGFAGGERPKSGSDPGFGVAGGERSKSGSDPGFGVAQCDGRGGDRLEVRAWPRDGLDGSVVSSLTMEPLSARRRAADEREAGCRSAGPS